MHHASEAPHTVEWLLMFEQDQLIAIAMKLADLVNDHEIILLSILYPATASNPSISIRPYHCMCSRRKAWQRRSMALRAELQKTKT